MQLSESFAGNPPRPPIRPGAGRSKGTELVREIVLVDDDPGFVETFGALLRHEGYAVTTEQTLAGALRYLSTHTPDVLITDVRLGAQNGWQLAKYATQHHPDLRVIVVTALADHLDAELEYWHLPVFLKPFDPDELLRHLRSA